MVGVPGQGSTDHRNAALFCQPLESNDSKRLREQKCMNLLGDDSHK
jgi:hypothetical protein